MKKTKDEIIQDICFEYRVILGRAKDAHKCYLYAIKEKAANPEHPEHFDRECYYYTERSRQLELCRTLRNFLIERKQQRAIWENRLVSVRDRRWTREEEQSAQKEKHI